MVGIIGYGSYVPCYRIKAEEIAHQWGKNPETIKRGLLLKEKPFLVWMKIRLLFQ